MNQPFRAGLASGFYNLSVYDSRFLAGLAEEYIFPDGSALDIELVQKLQDIFLDLMNTTMDIKPITFPVVTACFAVDEESNILDEDFLQYIAKKNQAWGFINIYGGKTSTLSSCCFNKSQLIMVKAAGRVQLMPIGEYYDLPYVGNKENMTVFHNGSWVAAKAIKLPGRQMYRVQTANNKELLVTDNHLHPVLRNGKQMDVPTSQLTTQDYLLCNTAKLGAISEQDRCLTYEQGVLIGAYLGDGSIYDKRDGSTPTINFSLNAEKYEKLIGTMQAALDQFQTGKQFMLGKEQHHVYPVVVRCKELQDFIRTWVTGSYAPEKELNIGCLGQSPAFRQGICDGYYLTDGGNSNRIYSTSENLVYQMEAVFTSLGVPTVINISDRTNEPCIIRGKESKRHFPLYCIRWYDRNNRRSMKNVYKMYNNSLYFKVSKTEQIESDEKEPVYCFEVVNQEEPYFTLPSGIITHNCRLRSNRANQYLGYSNSFGAGSTKIGLTFGPIQIS